MGAEEAMLQPKVHDYFLLALHGLPVLFLLLPCYQPTNNCFHFQNTPNYFKDCFPANASRLRSAAARQLQTALLTAVLNNTCSGLLLVITERCSMLSTVKHLKINLWAEENIFQNLCRAQWRGDEHFHFFFPAVTFREPGSNAVCEKLAFCEQNFTFG